MDTRAGTTFNPSRTAVQIERDHRELQLIFVERVAEALAKRVEPRGVDPLVVARMQLEERPGALIVSSQKSEVRSQKSEVSNQ